jgi:hypothetical protein
MDTRSWHSSANRYYAFSGEEFGLLQRISKTPPPARSSRSPPSATYNRKSAPTSPTFGSSTLLKSSLLDRISPKGYSPQSAPGGDLSSSSPVLGGCLDSCMDEEEEEQVIRVLDNNKELVFQRDFGMDERQDHDSELHESRNSSPVKKRKLVHPNQPTNDLTPQPSPTQTESDQKTKHTRSHSHSPPPPQSNATPPPKKQPLASQSGVDWSSGSSSGGGSLFGKRSGLTFGFAGYGYDTSAEVNTTGKATTQNRTEATPGSEPPQDNVREPSPPLTSVITQDQSDQARGPSTEEGGIFGGTSSLRRIGSHRPTFDPELEVPVGGGADQGSDHEARHEGEMAEDAMLIPPAPPSVLPPQSEDLHMDPPPPIRTSPRTPSREDPEGSVVQFESVASSRQPTPPPKSRTSSQAEVAEEEIKSMEQHAEDLLQDIQKEFLSKTEARISSSSTELEGIVPGFSTEGDPSVSLHDQDEPPRAYSTPILDGISPLVGTRSISPFFDIDHHDLTFDALSISTHTPRSTAGNLPASIVRSTSFPTSDPGSNDILLEVDPDVDQITKQALGDLIVYSLKLNHNIDAKEGWENSNVFRRAVNQEVDDHARDFLRLAMKLARRMDSMTELCESTEVPDAEPNQLMAESILPDAAENGYLEYLPPSDGAEGNEEPPPCEEDARLVDSDVEMASVPPEVPHSDSQEHRAKPNDEPAGEQKLEIESTNGHVERVDHTDNVEPDEGDPEESGLEIPGVWCVRTGKDRTDTIQEHIEVSEALAARVKKWTKKNGGSGK